MLGIRGIIPIAGRISGTWRRRTLWDASAPKQTPHRERQEPKAMPTTTQPPNASEEQIYGKGEPPVAPEWTNCSTPTRKYGEARDHSVTTHRQRVISRGRAGNKMHLQASAPVKVKQPCQNSAAKGLPLYTHCRSQRGPSSNHRCKNCRTNSFLKPKGPNSCWIESKLRSAMSKPPKTPAPPGDLQINGEISSPNATNIHTHSRRLWSTKRQAMSPLQKCRQADHHKGESNPNHTIPDWPS